MKTLQRLFVCLLALPAVARAQTVQGVVVDPTDRPVSGVVVLLLDSASNTAARALTNVRGEYRLVATRGGAYRVRTMRIGFRPVTSEPIALAAGREVTRRLVLTGLPIALDTIRVASNRNACRLVADSAQATYLVWEQVRTALTAAQLTDSSRMDATTVTYERTLDPSARRVWKQAFAIRSDFVTQPWESMSPDGLHRMGYVTTAGDWTTYFAPGIDALLSQSFVEDHCVHLVDAPADKPGRIGIAFEPTSARRQTPEIRGTLWLDRATSELRGLEFGYVNVPRARQEQAGGEMEFARMSDGQWAISRWNIKMPVLLMGLSSGNEAKVAEVRVAGGELSMVMKAGDTLWSRPPMRLAGTVIDSATGTPISGAKVGLYGTFLEGVSDATGRFTVSGVLPGEYVLNVTTPALDSVGATVQSVLAFTDTARVYEVKLPTAQQIATTMCGTTKFEQPGIISGSAILRGDVTPPGGARIVAEWRENGRPHWAETTTDPEGTFRVCGVPVNTAVAFRATTDSAVAAPAEVTIPTNARFARVELTLDARVTGVATFSGAVVTDSSDRPIADAEISLPGIQKIGLTNERGAFRLADIPAGEHQVNVRRVGYGPVDTKITFASNETVRRRIMMSRSNRLDTVVVTESVLPSTFDEHKKLGLGKFITREELEKARGRRLSEVLGSIQGAGMITGAMGNAYLASSRGMSARLPGCSPGVFATFNGDGLKTKPGGAATPTCAMSTADPGNGIYCPEGPQEKLRGIGCGCYAQVYMDRQLLNPVTSQLVNGKLVRATPPFDINSFGLDQVEAIEFYKSASETPGMYAALDSPCGVLVLWTRRSH